MTTRRAAVVAAVVAAACTVACGSSPPSAVPTSTTATITEASAPAVPNPADRPYEVDVVDLTLVDESRPTTDAAGAEVAAERTLPTVVHVPQGGGPFPLVAFAHGFGGDPQRFSQLLGEWAAAGYVVAAPTFPITSAGSPHYSADAWVGVADQPGDLSFVIDEVLDLSAEEGSELSGAVDPERIAAAGMSLGGGTAYGVAFNDCCRDERLDAVTIISGIPFPVGGEFDFTGGLPTFVIHGDADATLPYTQAQATFAELDPPKFLLTLFGGSHSPPSEDWESPWDTVVETTTVDFWDAYLATAGGEPDEAALARLSTDAVAGDVATLDPRP